MTAAFNLPRNLWLDGNGTPLAGGKLYFYEAGTSTPLNTYSDEALTTPNTNPVVANASGYWGAIYLSLASSYKVILKTSADVEVWSQDNVSIGLSSSTGSGSIGYIEGDSGSTPRTVQSRLRDFVTANDFGADPTGVSDSSAAIGNALASGKDVYIPQGTYLISNLTMSTVGQRLWGDGTLKCPASGTGITITGNKAIIDGLTFNANGATYCIVSSGEDVSIRNNNFSGNVGHYILAAGNRTAICDNVIDGSTATSITCPIVVQGAYPTFRRGFTVSGNKFYDTLGFGIQTRLACQDVIISRNQFYQPEYTDTIVATGGQTVFNFTLSKVMSRTGIRVNGVPVETGVTITGSGPAYTATFGAGRALNDSVVLSGFRSLEPININSDSHDILISDNTINGSGDSGIVLCADYHDGSLGTADSDDYPRRIVVSGNNVRNCAYGGIVTTVPLTGVVINGNTVTDASMFKESGYFSSGIAISGERGVITSNTINNLYGYMDNGVFIGTYSVVGYVAEPSIVMGSNVFNGTFVRTYNIPNGDTSLRKRSILLTDGIIIPYPEAINLDSSFTNFPSATNYFSYAKSGGTGWNRDTGVKLGGAASLRTVAGEYVDVSLLANETFENRILYVTFWAKAAASSSAYFSIFTTLAGIPLADTCTVTSTSWIRYAMYLPMQDLTTNATLIRIGGTSGTVNFQHISINTISLY